MPWCVCYVWYVYMCLHGCTLTICDFYMCVRYVHAYMSTDVFMSCVCCMCVMCMWVWMCTCHDTHVKVIGQTQVSVFAFYYVVLSWVSLTNGTVSFQQSLLSFLIPIGSWCWDYTCVCDTASATQVVRLVQQVLHPLNHLPQMTPRSQSCVLHGCKKPSGPRTWET